MTEAEMAIRKALQELDVQWGNGVFNKGELRRILQTGLPVVPERVVKRDSAQGVGLLDLDDAGGH